MAAEYLDGTFWYIDRELNKWGKWALIHYPTEASLDKIRQWQTDGLKNVLKKDDKGYNIRWSCPEYKDKKDGTRMYFPQPKIVDEEGNPITSAIGHGSEGEVRLEIYETTHMGQKNKNARLSGIKITKLVEYTGRKEKDAALEKEHGF